MDTTEMAEIEDASVLVINSTELEEPEKEQKTAKESLEWLRNTMQRIWKKKWVRWGVGLVMIMWVVLIWVLSGELIQYIFKNLSFNKPFFVTYATTSLFSLYLLGYVLPSWRARFCVKKDLNVDNTDLEKHEHVHTSVVIRAAIFFCPIWFLANYSYNLSLDYTTVASVEVVTSTSTFFTFFFSLIFLMSKLNYSDIFINFVAVCINFLGIVLITLTSYSKETEYSSNPLFGNFLSFISAMSYGLYAVYAKKNLERDDGRLVNVSEFFGYVGIINIVYLAPLFVVLHLLDFEPFELPSIEVVLSLFLNSFFSAFLADYIWANAVLLTTPVVAAVGLSLAIPMSILADMLLHGNTTQLHYGYLIGSILCISGFLLVNIPTKIDFYWLKIRNLQKKFWREKPIRSYRRFLNSKFRKHSIDT